MSLFGFSVHHVKADEVTVTANKTPRETWWISLEIGDNALTIFAKSAADFEEILRKLREGTEKVQVIE